MVGYEREAFWTSSAIMTVIMFILMIISMLVPAFIAWHHKEKKQALIYGLCAVGGVMLWIPWLVAVILAVRRYEPPRKDTTVIKTYVLRILALGMLVAGLMAYFTFYRYHFNAKNGLEVAFYSILLLAASYFNGRVFWGGMMLLPPMFLSLIGSYGEVMSTVWFNAVFVVIGFVITVALVYTVIKSYLLHTPAKGEQDIAVKSKEHFQKVTRLGKKYDFGTGAPTPHFVGQSGNDGAKKVKLDRCANGHFYDSSIYGTDCPYCSSQKNAMTSKPKNEPLSATVEAHTLSVREESIPEVQTVPTSETKKTIADAMQAQPTAIDEETTQAQLVSVEEVIQNAADTTTAAPIIARGIPERADDANNSTPDRFYETKSSSQRKKPIVGWLVCIKGVYKGEGFPLTEGRNFIGRSTDMDICLSEDDDIADSKQATLIYEPRSRQYILAPGDVHELCYINGQVVLTSTTMEANDVLDMGKTSLMLIPCCGEKFSWENGLVK